MLLFLHGSDTFRSRQKLKELTDKFKKEVDPQGYNLSTFIGGQVEFGKIMDALHASPFMANKRMIVIEELSKLKLSDKEQESLLLQIDNVLEDETILIIWEGALGKRDLKKKLFTAVQKTKYILPFESWNAQQIAGWINQELQQVGITIDGAALQYLSLAIGENLWQASSEKNKLIAYAQANNLTNLDVKAVSLLIAGGAQDNIFALVDSISQGNEKEALKRLHDQLTSGSHELEVLTMIIRQYRILTQVQDGLQKGMTADQIAKEYGMHPFVVKKISTQARSFDQASLQKAYRLLKGVDKKMKSSGLSMTTLLSMTTEKLVLESR